MLDFYLVDDKKIQQGKRIIEPKFIIKGSPKDLMTRGGQLYGVFNKATGLWITGKDATDFLIEDIDKELEKCSKLHKDAGEIVSVRWMWDSDSKSMDKFIKYTTRQLPPNSFHPLDENVIFEDEETKRDSYASKKLPYSLKEGDCPAFDEFIANGDTIFDSDNATKLMWAVGACLKGDSKHIQKFIVLYGEAGSGKSTFLHILEMLFEGYWKTFDAKALGQSGNDFSMEAFKENPIIAIQHDGDLSKIEDNTRLNSLVSHESMEVNAKFEKKYTQVFHSFLFVGTNSPVKITNAKSGLIRRLIDVHPSGKKIPKRRYNHLMSQIPFELGAIASKCIKVYEELGENYFDDYIPMDMMAATNDFYDFLDYNYEKYSNAEIVTLAEAWKAYDEYCDFANAYKLSWRIFRTELRNYFKEYHDRMMIDGVRVRNVYSGFRTDRFDRKEKNDGGSGNGTWNITDSMSGSVSNPVNNWLIFTEQKSIFDEKCKDWKAQYEKDYGKGPQPEFKWDNVKTTLKDLDTSKTHYVKPPDDIPIVMMDFDKKGLDGKKSLELNLKAASKFKKTYAELSKSGQGIHLYYIWDGGPVDDLSLVYEEDVEIKTFNGNSAIRRKLSKCNSEKIVKLSSGLPKKERRKMVDWRGVENSKMLMSMIDKNLQKGYHGDTSSSINYINSLLNEAYEKGITYNIPMKKREEIRKFAEQSSHQADRCCAVVANMKFQSEDGDVDEPTSDEVFKKSIIIPNKEGNKIIVLDLEVYRPGKDIPGLFLVCWKLLGTPMVKENVVAMVNPKPHEIEDLLNHFELIGHNISEYDCYMLYAAARGDSVAELYQVSQDIIVHNRKEAKPWDAKKMVYADTYEYNKAAGQGMGLKKWEIMLTGLSRKGDEELKGDGYSDEQIMAISVFRGQIAHKEMDIPWDRPAPQEKWDEIIDYCKTDVLACEAVFWFTQNFFKARLAQVALAKALHGDKIYAFCRDTANTLSKKILIGDIKDPQRLYNYRNLALPVGSDQYEEYRQKFGQDYKFRVWDENGLPLYRDYVPGEKLPEGWSILPFFPGYIFDQFAPKGKKSFFMGDLGGEGGRTLSRPGLHLNVLDLDIASQYPNSIRAEVLFGADITKIYSELIEARIAIKHKDFEKAGSLLNGALKPFLSKESAKDLAQALKIIINSVYGLTSAGFKNEFRDERNIDNIVAKRGNLFMRVLQDQIEKRGYTVCHIKTDSIKIVNADKEIHEFAVKFAKEYGYDFEVEAEFSKFCLLNDAAYVGRLKDGSWMFKADEFKQPFVRKTLFTHEPIIFDDYCLTFSTKDSLYLDMNEGREPSKDDERRFKALNSKLMKHIGGDFSDDPPKGFDSWNEVEKEMGEIDARLRECHDMRFVGRVGQFTPVVKGAGGGILYRGGTGNYANVGGTKGYRWLESSDVQKLHMEDKIDLDYFRAMADRAKDDIDKLPNSNFEWFVSDEDFMNIPENINTNITVE